MGRGVGGEAPETTVMFAPLDGMEDLVLSTVLRPGETTPEKAIARLDAMVEAAFAAPTKADVDLVLNTFGFLFGFADLPEAALAANPYGVALGIARRRQTGLDPARVRGALPSVTRGDLFDVVFPAHGSESVAYVVPK
jgi:hypothetical protein